MKDTIARVLPYWEEAIVPELKAVKQQKGGTLELKTTEGTDKLLSTYIKLGRLDIEGGKN